jgi:hypothetical protein
VRLHSTCSFLFLELSAWLVEFIVFKLDASFVSTTQIQDLKVVNNDLALQQPTLGKHCCCTAVSIQCGGDELDRCMDCVRDDIRVNAFALLLKFKRVWINGAVRNMQACGSISMAKSGGLLGNSFRFLVLLCIATKWHSILQ